MRVTATSVVEGLFRHRRPLVSALYSLIDWRAVRWPDTLFKRVEGYMLRVGIMLDSPKTSAWVAGIVEQLQAGDFAHVELVVLNTPYTPPRPDLRKRLRNHWKLTAYHKYEQWDYRRHRSERDSKAETDIAPLLAGVPCLQVDPTRKGFSDYLREEDLEQIRGANLDVILRFGFRILKGGILDAARCGVWSFHHDDNLQYRGGPPLFWEVYEGNPVSGTILQVLTGALDGGKVLYRGHSATNLRSLYLNRNLIYWKTAEYAIRRLRDLNTHGWEYLQSLPTYNETDAIAPKIYRTPNFAQMSVFGIRLLGRAVRASLHSRLHGPCQQWFLALRRRTDAQSCDSAAGYKVIRPLPDRFYADPFLMAHGGRTYLFFEDYRYHERRALICCSEILPDGTVGEAVEVLRRPYHLSYPFVFEHEGEMYMVPETKEARTVELYKAQEFPWRWKLERVLLDNIHAVDATLHHDGARWWMFAGLSNGKYSNCDELALFSSETLAGPWRPHPASPVISDVRRARPGGALFRDAQGRLIRPSQNCARAYGYALVFSEVLTLNETEYAERVVGRIEPDWLPRNLGTHTYTRSNDFEVIDGNVAARFPRVS